MNKMLTLTAIALCAAASQAAAVKWTSGALYKPASADGGWSSTKAGTTVDAYYFVMDNNFSGAYDGTYAQGTTESDKDYAKRLYKAYKDGKLDEDAIAKSGKVTSSGSMSAKADWTTSVETAIEKQIFAVAIYTTKGTFDSKDVDFYIATGSQAGVNSFGDQSGGQGLAQGVGNWTAVPEPTTVALLALGLVAAGLKRKVA